MELKQFISGPLTLKEIKAPLYKDLKITELDTLTVGKIFLTAQTLLLTKAAIRERVAGAMDNYEISDNKLINDLPIRIHGDTFSAKTLVDACLNNNKSAIVGFTDFVKDVLIMNKLTRRLDSLNIIDCKFTREVLRLLNTRSDVTIFRELKIDVNLHVYFLNNEYMVLTHRGLVPVPNKSAMITPSTTQEFFVTIFKLGSLFESYIATSGFRGSKVKTIQFGKMETYQSTIRESNIETGMVFNSYLGPNGCMHWFFNDGYATRKDRLVVNYVKADQRCNFSICDNEWKQLKVQYGFPKLDRSFFKQFNIGK